MNKQEIMCAYNQHERINITLPGFQKHASTDIVRLVSETAHGSHIAYFNLPADRVDGAIENELAYFKQLNKPFEWKTYDTDSPADIGARLLAHGFQQGDAESFMVLNLDFIHAEFEVPDYVVEVSDLAGIQDAIAVQEQVWGGDMSDRLAQLHTAKKNTPDDISIYVVYDEDVPIASGWIIYNSASPFAGIWGGSTVKAYRGKGFYSALLHKRINDAKKNGKKFLTIDASPMSRPIVEKHGFCLMATTTPYYFGLTT